MTITAEEFAEWKEHPVTKEIFEQLKTVREHIKDQLADGKTIGPTAESTHGFTSKAYGQIEGINQLLNIHFVDGEDQENGNDQTGY